MMTSQRYSRIGRALALAIIVLVSSSCGTALTRTGKSPAFLIVDTLIGTAGGSTIVLSDVQTGVGAAATVASDTGTVTLRSVMKNQGTAVSPTVPTPINDITVSRYHVKFRRADGREQEGVTVPYAFDGGVAVTIPAGGTATFLFDLVRRSMKVEPPLSNLVGSTLSGFQGGFELSTIAEVTFYGRDQAGNEVSVMGMITVNFSDY